MHHTFDSDSIASFYATKGFYCCALACKTLSISLKEVLNLVIKLVNFVKRSKLNSHLFKEFCRDINADHESLLFCCAVQWLSKDNVICQVFDLRKELKEFLQLQKKNFVVALNDKNWCKQLTYLADIFGHLNKLNLKLQGTELNLITFKDTLCGFIAKLQNWHRKVDLGNIAMFESVFDLHGSGSDPAEQLKSEI